MKIATGDEAIAIKLHEHINFYVPKGWVGSIHEFDFAPVFLENEAKNLRIAYEEKKLDAYLKLHFKKWYVKDAIRDFFEKKLNKLKI